MKSDKMAIILGLVAISVLSWRLLHQPQHREAPTRTQAPQDLASLSPPSTSAQRIVAPPLSTQPIEERRRAVREQIQGVLSTPITFYGKVIDQNGAPVAGATINYGALDKFDAPGSQYQGKSDATGNFSISGIGGAVLRVGVQKAGYYRIDGKSSGAFGYGVRVDNARKEPPTADKPAIFVLQKMGATEPLLHVEARQYRMAKNGQPMEVDLQSGRQVPAGQGDIRFERWAGDHAKNERGQFDWRFQITAPGGGIIERQDQFAFEAPTEGYQQVVEINLPASLGGEWRYTIDRSYFVRTRYGRYARINASIYGGHNNCLVLESFINPNPNSRNLEFDPKKKVRRP